MRYYLLFLAVVVGATSWFGSHDPDQSPSSVSISSPQAATSAIALATCEIGRALDSTKDYFYSSWDDSRLRKWLEDHGVVEASKSTDRSQLITLVSQYFHEASDPVWQSWSDDYMRDWLIAHGIFPGESAPRSTLVDDMKQYYYSITARVWHSWSDSELKAWLVNRGFIGSDAKRHRDELIKMVEDHFLPSADSVWEAWSDSDIREWLTTNGYVDESISQQPRHELVDYIRSKYSDPSIKRASYLTWPDSRLRAYLRECGMEEQALPTSRPALLRETRVRWINAMSTTKSIFDKSRDVVNGGVQVIEDLLVRACQSLVGQTYQACRRIGDARDYAWDKYYNQVMRSGEKVGQSVHDAREQMKENVDDL